jgi:hypothetical protein
VVSKRGLRAEHVEYALGGGDGERRADRELVVRAVAQPGRLIEVNDDPWSAAEPVEAAAALDDPRPERAAQPGDQGGDGPFRGGGRCTLPEHVDDPLDGYPLPSLDGEQREQRPRLAAPYGAIGQRATLARD